MQKVKFHPLFTLFLVVIMAFGLMMIFSASSVRSLAETGNASMYVYFKQQLISNVLGVIAGLFVAIYPYTKWQKWILWGNIGVIILLILVGFTPLGMEVNGAKRWLNLGFISFQPSELAKFMMIVTVAHMLSVAKRFKNLNTWPVLAKIGGYIVGMSALIGIPQNHASVIMIILLVTGTMVYFAGLNRLLVAGCIAAGGAVGAFIILTSEFRRERFFTFLDPLADKLGDGYQITQNWYALGSGELTGVGLGLGRAKFGWLPEAHTDFILGVIGEEFGYLGILFVIILVLGLFISGISIALATENPFGTLIVTGVMFLFLYQAAINMAVVSGLFPVTGIPLSFISYGGTSNIIMCMMMGAVYNVYSNNQKLEEASI